MGGNIDGWVKFVKRARGGIVRVGLFDGEVAEIGKIHEYGAPRANIPERSFLRATMRERKPELKALMARLVRLQLKGVLNEHRALELLGAWLQGAIKGRIVSGPFTPLKPTTIARKGSDKPLIDTAQMINSITFVIVD